MFCTHFILMASQNTTQALPKGELLWGGQLWLPSPALLSAPLLSDTVSRRATKLTVVDVEIEDAEFNTHVERIVNSFKFIQTCSLNSSHQFFKCCLSAEPVVRGEMSNLPDGSVFIYCQVGERT